MSFAKIIGDLIGGFAIHIAGAAAAALIAFEVYDALEAAAKPVIAALG